MPDVRAPAPFSGYEPPRRPGRVERAQTFLTRDLTRKDLATVLVALAGAIAALGWSVVSPRAKIAEVDDRLSKGVVMLAGRVDRNEHRIDTLAEAQRFTNWMLCMNARRTDPAGAPPDCIPIIETRKRK